MPLSPGGTGEYRSRGWLSEEGLPMENPSQVAPQDAILLCDGVFLFRPELNDYWDYRIFVHITPELSLLRGVPRDAEGWAQRKRHAADTRSVGFPASKCTSIRFGRWRRQTL
jgi:uridine kinase